MPVFPRFVPVLADDAAEATGDAIGAALTAAQALRRTMIDEERI